MIWGFATLALLVSLLGSYIFIEIAWFDKRLKIISNAEDDMILEKIKLITKK